MNKYKIAHFADVHIHNTKYHDKYRFVFEKVYEELNKIQPDRIVIVGDLFVSFVSVSNEAKELAGELLNKLSKIAPVIIVPGNHDILRNRKDRLNTVQLVVELLNNPNITYYDKSDLYEDGDIVWVNYSHLEKGIIPWEVDTNILSERQDKIYIGLYHDQLIGAEFESATKVRAGKYPGIDYFADCDYTLLGDIHKEQYFRENKSIAYCGSTIQQDVSEGFNKGFLMWYIDDKINFTTEKINIYNPYNFVTLNIKEGFDYENIILDDEHITSDTELRIIWNDYSANIDNIDNLNNIKKYVSNKWGINKIRFERIYIDSDISELQSLNESINVLDISEQRKLFVEYLELNKYDKEFINDILEIDDIINNRIVTDDSYGKIWDILSLNFSNFKSYGDDNEIDFTKMSSPALIQIAGLNKQGKTTILDAISYVLYGVTTSTTKREKAGDARYLNNKRDLDDVYGTIVLLINGEKFTISRKTIRKWNRNRTDVISATTTVDYFKGDDTSGESLNDEQRKDTQKIIESTIGNFNDFQRLVQTDSDNLNMLLSQDRAVFMDSLIRDAGFDIFEQKLNELKEYKKNIVFNRKSVNFDEVNKNIETNILNIEEKTTEMNLVVSSVKEIEKDKKIKDLERKNKFSELEKIDPIIESLNIDDIQLDIDTETEKISKNKERLILIKNLKVEVENYDDSKLEKTQDEYNLLLSVINESKLEVSELEKDLMTKKNELMFVGIDINNMTSAYTSNLTSSNKDYNLEISKVKEEFTNHINEYTTKINKQLSDIINEQTKINSEIDTIINEGKKLKKETNDIECSSTCITCGRTLEGIDMSTIHLKIQYNKDEMVVLRNKINALKPKSEELELKTTALNDIIKKLKDRDYTFDEELLGVYDNSKSKIKEYKDLIEKNSTVVDLIKDNILPVDLNKSLKPFYNKRSNISEVIGTIETEIKNSKKTLDIKNDEVDDLKGKITILKNEKEDIDKKKEKISLEPTVQMNISKSEVSIKEYKKQINEYNKTLDKIENNKLINAEIETIDTEIEELNETLSDKNEEKINLVSTIKVLESQLIQYDEDIKEYNKQKKEDEIINAYMKCVHRDGLPNYLLKKSIHIINKQLDKILSGVDFTVFFDDELELKMSNRSRMDVFQGGINCSGMERSFIAIALKISLRTINTKSRPNLFLLDEIMGKLDTESVEEFLNLLDKIKYDVGKLLIIEHNHPINYDVLIEVTKDEDGISSLEVKM